MLLRNTHKLLSKIKMSNNETIGMTAEQAFCNVYSLSSGINKSRINTQILSTLTPVITLFKNKHPQINITESCGYENGKVDFKLLNNKTLSLKTLKKNDGKICPQGGQPTYNSFHTHNPLCPVPPNNSSRLEANTIRWNWIKSNIKEYLHKMLNQTFCCDYLALISNCEKSPRYELLNKSNINFSNIDIKFRYPEYNEHPHKTKIGELAEFSTIVFYIEDGERKNIGEFQIHFKSRNEIKFRFYKSFLTI